MDRIEDDIRRILDGHAVENQNFCDFTLEEQNEATASKGVTPAAPSNYVPVVKTSVCYIVAAVLVNEDDEVLMMQEAKSSCAGQWYLPAGRMEPGENIEDAVKREVLEETGLDIEATTLLMVESASGSWFRFVLTGNVLGGKLKTPADADSESLQAKWVKDIGQLSLRARDIVPLINRCRQYHTERDEPWHSRLLPALNPHRQLLFRLIICIRKRSNNRVHVLLSEKTEVHLPMCEINPGRSVHSTLKKYMTEIFGADLPPHRPHGVLSVEHCGKPEGTHDGICITLLVSIRKALEEVGIIDKYTWLEVSTVLGDEILNRLAKNMTVQLNVIR